MTRRTNTSVSVDLVYAGRTLGTRRRLTLVYIDATVWTGETSGAFTTKPVDTIDTTTTVITGEWITIISVSCTGESLPAVFTDAGEGFSSADARPAVLTRTRVTRTVLGRVAGAAAPARRAAAQEGVAVVVTRPSVTAGRRITLALSRVAGFSLPVVHAVAVEVVEQIDAAASVLTRVLAALVHIDITEAALPAAGA